MARKPKGRKVDATGRSKGEEQYVPIPYSMARSDAFRTLSGPALKVWVEIRSRYNGYNNGQLSLSYQEAADLLHLSKSTVRRAFEELEDRGFIKRRVPGHWYGRRAAEYIMTDRKHAGELPTRDWLNWRPSPPSKKQKSVPRRHAKPVSVPPEYHNDPEGCRQSTRHGHLRVIDGAT